MEQGRLLERLPWQRELFHCLKFSTNEKFLQICVQNGFVDTTFYCLITAFTTVYYMISS